MSTKLAFTIHEASDITGVPSHTIRFWEKDFTDFLRPARTPGGQRRYCRRDIAVIQYMKHLRYEKKYTIAGTLDALRRSDYTEHQSQSSIGTDRLTIHSDALEYGVYVGAV